MKLLVAWYGSFQAVHIFINARGLLQLAQGSIDFPALPPPGGWSLQAMHFLTAMASLDLLNAILTLAFVYGFFRQTRWHTWLGTLTLTVSMYAAMIFDYATWASGAWTGHLPGYLFTNITFLPVILLFVLFSLRAMFWETGQAK
jgi:hypothetical protein